MLLDRILKFLIDLYSIEKINEALCDIYDDKMYAAIEKGDKEQAGLFDELSESYDQINRMLQVRPFRGMPIGSCNDRL
jgi:hypothetical protein